LASKNFGSLLFSSIAADTEQAVSRRRALTEVEEYHSKTPDVIKDAPIDDPAN
jgi:hypothetical protein